MIWFWPSECAVHSDLAPKLHCKLKYLSLYVNSKGLPRHGSVLRSTSGGWFPLDLTPLALSKPPPPPLVFANCPARGGPRLSGDVSDSGRSSSDRHRSQVPSPISGVCSLPSVLLLPLLLRAVMYTAGREGSRCTWESVAACVVFARRSRPASGRMRTSDGSAAVRHVRAFLTVGRELIGGHQLVRSIAQWGRSGAEVRTRPLSRLGRLNWSANDFSRSTITSARSMCSWH